VAVNSATPAAEAAASVAELLEAARVHPRTPSGLQDRAGLIAAALCSPDVLRDHNQQVALCALAESIA